MEDPTAEMTRTGGSDVTRRRNRSKESGGEGAPNREREKWRLGREEKGVHPRE